MLAEEGFEVAPHQLAGSFAVAKLQEHFQVDHYLAKRDYWNQEPGNPTI